MVIDFMFVNALVNFAYLLVGVGFCTGIGWYFLGRPPRWYFAAVGLVVVSLTYVDVTKRNAPRFVITDQTGSAPVVSGTVTSDAPARLTDAERLEQNRKLNAENALD